MELVFDDNLGVYVVVGYPDHYHDGKHYYRWAQPQRHRSIWILPCLLLLVPFASEAQDWQERINHLWTEESIQTPTAPCQMYALRTIPPLVRGSIAGRSCLIKAISAGRHGNRALAGAWLRAGYCGDKKVRQEIAQAGAAAVDDALKKFGPMLP